MQNKIFFNNFFNELSDKINSCENTDLDGVANLILQTHNKGNKIILAGNGGSASIASHVAIDFTKAAGIKAINFNEANLLTCFANDYGYEHWVEKALEFYADTGDLAILISSSGKSLNLLNGARLAKAKGLNLITLSGFASGNPLRKLGDLNLWVDSSVYNIVEMTHHIWLVAVNDYLIEKNKMDLAV